MQIICDRRVSHSKKNIMVLRLKPFTIKWLLFANEGDMVRKFAHTYWAKQIGNDSIRQTRRLKLQGMHPLMSIAN